MQKIMRSDETAEERATDFFLGVETLFLPCVGLAAAARLNAYYQSSAEAQRKEERREEEFVQTTQEVPAF